MSSSPEVDGAVLGAAEPDDAPIDGAEQHEPAPRARPARRPAPPETCSARAAVVDLSEAEAEPSRHMLPSRADPFASSDAAGVHRRGSWPVGLPLCHLSSPSPPRPATNSGHPDLGNATATSSEGRAPLGRDMSADSFVGNGHAGQKTAPPTEGPLTTQSALAGPTGHWPNRWPNRWGPVRRARVPRDCAQR